MISCNKDDESLPSDLIIGRWTIESTDIDLSLDNKSLVQYLVDEFELSQVEAELIVNPLLEAIMETFTGSIDFKEDHTYVIDIGGEIDSGTWYLSSDGKTLLLDEGTMDETEATIITLTSSTMQIEMTQNAEEDINADGQDEQLSMEVIMTLIK